MLHVRSLVPIFIFQFLSMSLLLNLLFEPDPYSNEYLVSKFGLLACFDTAENEFSRVYQNVIRQLDRWSQDKHRQGRSRAGAAGGSRRQLARGEIVAKLCSTFGNFGPARRYESSHPAPKKDESDATSKAFLRMIREAFLRMIDLAQMW